MADALRFAPWLLIAVVAAPAAAGPRTPALKLQSPDAGRLSEPTRTREPLLGFRSFDEDAMPDWSLKFGPGADERSGRGLRFGIKPGRGLKATAKLRF